jgi:hypothetical protein
MQFIEETGKEETPLDLVCGSSSCANPLSTAPNLCQLRLHNVLYPCYVNLDYPMICATCCTQRTPSELIEQYRSHKVIFSFISNRSFSISFSGFSYTSSVYLLRLKSSGSIENSYKQLISSVR